jgi:hypothetical protein
MKFHRKFHNENAFKDDTQGGFSSTVESGKTQEENEKIKSAFQNIPAS